MMNPTRTQSPLGNLKTTAFPEKNVIGGDPHLLEQNQYANTTQPRVYINRFDIAPASPELTPTCL